MTALKNAIRKKRSQMGYTTNVQESVPGISETNSLAERAFQTVRRQAVTLVQALQARCRVGIPHTHPVFSWAFRHAGWILNRFHVHSGTGMTPYEFCTGTPYQGMLCEHGESLLCHVISVNPNKRKGDAHWSKGVFLGKSDNDLYLTWHPQGLLACRTVQLAFNHGMSNLLHLLVE